MIRFRKQEKNFVRIPLDVKGHLYISPMPYGPYDRGNTLMKIYLKHKIDYAILLVTDAELEKKAKRDLLAAYKKNGIGTIRYPIADYTSPELHALMQASQKATAPKPGINGLRTNQAP